jgi:hypothetical protein
VTRLATTRSLEDWNRGLPSRSSSKPQGHSTGSVLNLGANIARILDYYASEGNASPLLNVLSHALSEGASSALLEHRYTDIDYRDEHQTFYSTTHRRYPSSCHRMHFFKEDVKEVRLAIPLNLRRLTYLGYTVLRPVRAAAVGRTMLPLKEPREGIFCRVKDTVQLFGTPLTVEGMPFISQDAQLSRCAHATVWNTAYYHHLAFKVPRILPSQIASPSADLYAPAGRAIPSPGLTPIQLSIASSSIGLPPVIYPLDKLARGEEVERTVCRYLNSRLPVTITTSSHAFTLLGYERVRSVTGEDSIRFWSHDDEVGPYRKIDNWRMDPGGAWRIATVPLPRKVYLPGESAEKIARTLLPRVLAPLNNSLDVELANRLKQDAVARAGDKRSLSWRSMVLPSNEFKRLAFRRGYSDQFLERVLLAQLSRWVWVVELTDRDSIYDPNKQPKVLADAIIDATEHARDPHLLLWSSGASFGHWRPDTDEDVVYTAGMKTGARTSVSSLVELYQSI